MLPLVIGLAAVVLVIIIAVAVGMRYVRNEERADLADREEDRGRPAEGDRGRTTGRQDPDWRRAGQQPGPQRPPARPKDGPRQRRADARGRGERAVRGERPRGGERAGRGEDRGYGDADTNPSQGDRRRDGSGHATRGHGDSRDEPARAQPRQEARSAVRARSARSRKYDEGDWPSTDWDKLSDADYWKEVASDRPLVTTARTAQPAQRPAPESRPAPPAPGRAAAAPAGPAPGRGPGPRPALDARHGHEPNREAVRLPMRGAPEPAAAGGSRDFLTAPTSVLYPEPIRPEPIRPEPAFPDPGRQEQLRPGLASPMGRPAGQRPPAPMLYDDDPLTSPSFPRIVTSDSRSYGSGRPSAPSAQSAPAGRPSAPAGRPAAPASRSAAPPAAAGGPADQSAYGAPTAQFASHGPARSRSADDGLADGYGRGFADSSSAATAPRSYRPAAQPPDGSYPASSHQPSGHSAGTGPGFPAGQYFPAGQQQPARPPAAGPLPAIPPPSVPLPAVPPPSGNPYGSYVSTDLPGYAESAAPAYPQRGAERNYPGYPVGSANGHAGSAYSYDLPLDDSAPPLGSAGGWYPEAPAASAPAPSPGSPGPFPHAGAQADGMSRHDSGNGQRSPSGYAPGPYADRHHDVPEYPPAGYGARPDLPEYPPSSGHSPGQPDVAGYLPPPDFYGRDGYGG